jgi:hypothetical protein
LRNEHPNAHAAVAGLSAGLATKEVNDPRVCSTVAFFIELELGLRRLVGVRIWPKCAKIHAKWISKATVLPAPGVFRIPIALNFR